MSPAQRCEPSARACKQGFTSNNNNNSNNNNQTSYMMPDSLVTTSLTAAQAVPAFGASPVAPSSGVTSGDLAHAETSLMTSNLAVPRLYPMTTNEVGVNYQAFFARPIVIVQFSWTATHANIAHNLYNLYLNNATILRKLFGYSRIRFKMHLRIEWHPTAFHFGEMVAAIEHKDGSDNHGYGSYLTLPLMAYHLQHVVMSAANPRIVEMEVPFLHPEPYVDLLAGGQLTTPDPAVYLPYLIFNDVVPLGFSNGAAVPEVAVTVRAWLTDVELNGPTGYTPFSQSGPVESPVGPVTKVFHAAGALFRAARVAAPSFAPFLRPAEAFAKLGGGVAALLGFSVPSDTRTPAPVRAVDASSYSQVDVGSSSTKLTFSSDATTTVSTIGFGGGGSDEMTLSTWAESESPLFLFPWTLATATGTTIGIIPVSPRFATYDGATWVSATNLMYLCKAFGSWRGDIIYRFRVVCSQQHRGRLRFVYEPGGAVIGAEPFGMRSHCVMDLDADREIDLCVSWASNQNWLHLPHSATVSAAGFPAAMSATGTTYNDDADNGALFMIVEAPLIAPQPTNNDVTVFCSIRGGPNFAVADATVTHLLHWTPAVNQSGPVAAPRDRAAEPAMARPGMGAAGPMVCYINGREEGDGTMGLVTWSESIASIRALVKRFCFYTVLDTDGGGVVVESGSSTFTWTLPGMPNPGYRNGDDIALPDACAVRPDWTYLTWFMQGYKGIRGGVRWRARLPPSYRFTTGGVPTVNLDGQRLVAWRSSTSAGGWATGTAGFDEYLMLGNGCTLGSSVEGAVDFELPYDSRSSFVTCRHPETVPYAADWGLKAFSVSANGFLGQENVSKVGPWLMVAAADDTTLLGFVGAPAIRVRS